MRSHYRARNRGSLMNSRNLCQVFKSLIQSGVEVLNFEDNGDGSSLWQIVAQEEKAPMFSLEPKVKLHLKINPKAMPVRNQDD